jgi:hypothetical protein
MPDTPDRMCPLLRRGVSTDSRFRRGLKVPHARHWATLAEFTVRGRETVTP